MEREPKRRARSRATTIFVALLSGLVVLLLLFPASGVTTDPPECYAMLAYVVPCEAWIAWSVGAVTAGVVALAWDRSSGALISRPLANRT